MNNNIKAVVEGLLFVYGDEGISLLDLQNVLEDVRPVTIQETILELEKKYSSDVDSAFSIQKFGKNKYRLQTKPELHEYFAKLELEVNNSRLSNSSIEVLSIIVYKGPISKHDIELIRQAECSYQIYRLRQKKLIKAVGKTSTGANLYTITDNFFKLFNITGGFEALPQIDFASYKNENDENDFDEDTKITEEMVSEDDVFNEDGSEEIF
ncbi:chromosome condensation and segregation factor B [Mesoplasma entomophilum]|uniref:SMC-Scp complex subunit ScpB n=1 Tax=Mesoplasma entomophilum TaxID=2149 RepID=A0A3S5Y0I0_9MOLU|nr:SMC-Scp complex subunit ScpB [Mesoplasma entomophilum]ATQ35729.1 SMC-Scp complex subunit ScpB [Mesoplasma entomophilum]ATZ19698.1 chromosome condensation and segregation factor B [Mesoplasma entomophilum]